MAAVQPIWLVGADLIFGAKAAELARANGGGVRMARADDDFAAAAGATVFVSLAAGPGALVAIRALKSAGAAEIVAWGPHADEAAMAAALAAGAGEAIPNSRFEARLRRALGA